MSKPLFVLLLWLISLAPACAQPTFLPLHNGNVWTYQQEGGTSQFTVRVGTPYLINNTVYYSLSGYAERQLLVRFDQGNLYYRYEEAEQDRLLTSFEVVPGGWSSAPFRQCEQEGQPQEQPGRHDGPAGLFEPTRDIRYRTFQCADAGVLEEQYVPNIGMVQRTVSTIAGPRTYKLISARVGMLTLQTAAGAGFFLRLEQRPGAIVVNANLELTVRGSEPVRLQYLSGQEIDVVLRADDGSVVWQWSEGKLFTMALRDELTMGRTWLVDVPLQDRAQTPLRPGRYQVEAWIASGHDRPQFIATAPLIVPERQP